MIDFEYDRFLVENPDLKKINERTEYTLIKKSYVHKMPTPMQDLLDILESPAAYEHHKFVVSGKIVSFSSNSVATIVKKFDEHTKKMYAYFTQLRVQRESPAKRRLHPLHLPLHDHHERRLVGRV